MTASPACRGLFREQHPIGPVTGMDPLDPRTLAPSGRGSPGDGQLGLGFACIWEPIPQQTWSGSALSLRHELGLAAHVVDLGVRFPSATRTALKALHTHYRGGRLTTSWSYSRLTDRYITHSLRRNRRLNRGADRLEAVLTIDAIAAVAEPFFVYYDSSWDLLISGAGSLQHFAGMRLLTEQNIRRRRDLQVAIFERAAGVIAMSRWLARSLIEQSGVPADKVHVVPPGRVVRRPVIPRLDSASMHQMEAARPAPPRSQAGALRRRLLFVGRLYNSYDFYRKGGDLVVDALRILRGEYDPRITLTMAGIDKWPLPADPPDGIDICGVVSRDEVAKLYETHDLFVMPSRMEPFGLVFAEALCQGMPCIARNACAMPEIVTPGVSGALITSDDPHELADAIWSVLADDDLYKNCQARAPAMTEYFSWNRAAREVIDVINREVR